MASHGDLSPEARERAERTVTAADVFAEHAEHIHEALPEVPDEHVLVALVDRGHVYSGTRHVATDQLIAKVPELEERGGWVLVFSPGTDLDEVRRRIEEMGTLARRRGDAIDRILARRDQSS